MKKLFLLSLFLMLSFSMYGQLYLKVVNVNSSLNVRSYSDANSEIVGQLSGGDIVKFISEMDPEEQHDSGECWLLIRKGDIEGWVMCDYLQETSEKPAEMEAQSQSEPSGSWIVRTWNFVAGNYIKIFWSTDGTWGIILKVIGIIVLLLLVVPFFCGFGVILHGVIGGIMLGIVGLIFWFLGWCTGDTAGTIATVGFFIGCAYGIYLLVTDKDEFLEIFDGFFSGGPSTSNYEGGNNPKERRCGNCKYYHDTQDCRRFPGSPSSTQSHYLGCDHFEWK